MTSPTRFLATYKAQLQQGDIQQAYHYLLKYLMSLRSHLSQVAPTSVNIGNVSPGYLDYSYFPFFTDTMRTNLLRFGIVLNHKELRFELWLMGQNAAVQDEYWQRLKDSPWNQHRSTMPQYSVLEVVLAADPNFDDPNALSTHLCSTALAFSDTILEYLKLDPITP